MRYKDLQSGEEKWRNEGFADPFQIRMGMNTGYCNVGNFGSDQRLTYTIIGGEVNVAQRLEANADAGGILLSYETYAHAQDMIEVEEKQAISMKGVNRKIKIYSIVSRSIIGELQDEEAKKTGTERRVMNNTPLEVRMQNLENELATMRRKMDFIATKNQK